MSGSILQRVAADPAYTAGIEWGSARLGHPEGKIKNHIVQLERNLEKIADLISPAEADKLRLLVHTHDTFKSQGGEDIPVSDSKSHAGLAAEFLTKYSADADTKIGRAHV